MYYFGHHCMSMNVEHNKSGKTISESINYRRLNNEKQTNEQTNKQHNCLEYKFLFVFQACNYSILQSICDENNSTI